MTFHDIEQGSDEWFELRIGKITSSHFAEIMVNSIDRKGAFSDVAKWGKDAEKYAMRLSLERKTGKRIDTFQNAWMNRGNELEPIARSKYENKTFQLVNNGGLFINDNLATSPDGLVDGVSGLGIEIKCVAFNTHFVTLESEFYDAKYKWQMHGQMLVAQLENVDYISYCPEHPKETELYIYRVKQNNIQCDQISKRLVQFESLIEHYQKLIGGNNEIK